MEGNGGQPSVITEPTSILTLTYYPLRDKLDVDVRCSSLDQALDMLERARRTLESQWRLRQLAAMQQAQADAELRAALAGQHSHRTGG